MSNTKKAVFLLLIDVRGSRFNSSRGEVKNIYWRNPSFTPRLVAQARAGEAIDWGGAMVQPRDYEFTDAA